MMGASHTTNFVIRLQPPRTIHTFYRVVLLFS